MTKQVINLGTEPDGKDGDPSRTAWGKANGMFSELYSADGTQTTAAIAQAEASAANATADAAKSAADAAQADADTANHGLLAINPVGAFKNRFINGGWSIWQRGVSQTIDGYGSADRWRIATNGGATKTFARQNMGVAGFAAGVHLPQYYATVTVASANSSTSACSLVQRVEDVRSLAGNTVTISGWVYCNTAGKKLAFEFLQSFGTGGSVDVPSIGVSQVVLTAGFQYFSTTIDIPSVAGKVIGDGSFLSVNIWMDAGSSFDSRTGALGNQSGIFGFGDLQLEPGRVATSFEERPIGVEQELCERYYQRLKGSGLMGITLSTTAILATANWRTAMRSSPAITLLKTSFTTTTFDVFAGAGWVAGSGCTLVGASTTPQGFISQVAGFVALTVGQAALFNLSQTDLLSVDAEY